MIFPGTQAAFACQFKVAGPAPLDACAATARRLRIHALVVQESRGADRQKCWPSGCGVLSNRGVGTLAPLVGVFVPFLEKDFLLSDLFLVGEKTSSFVPAKAYKSLESLEGDVRIDAQSAQSRCCAER